MKNGPSYFCAGVMAHDVHELLEKTSCRIVVAIFLFLLIFVVIQKRAQTKDSLNADRWVLVSQAFHEANPKDIIEVVVEGGDVVNDVCDSLCCAVTYGLLFCCKKGVGC